MPKPKANHLAIKTSLFSRNSLLLSPRSSSFNSSSLSSTSPSPSSPNNLLTSPTRPQSQSPQPSPRRAVRPQSQILTLDAIATPESPEAATSFFSSPDPSSPAPRTLRRTNKPVNSRASVIISPNRISVSIPALSPIQPTSSTSNRNSVVIEPSQNQRGKSNRNSAVIQPSPNRSSVIIQPRSQSATPTLKRSSVLIYRPKSPSSVLGGEFPNYSTISIPEIPQRSSSRASNASFNSIIVPPRSSSSRKPRRSMHVSTPSKSSTKTTSTSNSSRPSISISPSSSTSSLTADDITPRPQSSAVSIHSEIEEVPQLEEDTSDTDLGELEDEESFTMVSSISTEDRPSTPSSVPSLIGNSSSISLHSAPALSSSKKNRSSTSSSVSSLDTPCTPTSSSPGSPTSLFSPSASSMSSRTSRAYSVAFPLGPDVGPRTHTAIPINLVFSRQRRRISPDFRSRFPIKVPRSGELEVSGVEDFPRRPLTLTTVTSAGIDVVRIVGQNADAELLAQVDRGAESE